METYSKPTIYSSILKAVLKAIVVLLMSIPLVAIYGSIYIGISALSVEPDGKGRLTEDIQAGRTATCQNLDSRGPSYYSCSPDEAFTNARTEFFFTLLLIPVVFPLIIVQYPVSLIAIFGSLLFCSFAFYVLGQKNIIRAEHNRGFNLFLAGVILAHVNIIFWLIFYNFVLRYLYYGK